LNPLSNISRTPSLPINRVTPFSPFPLIKFTEA
jgi:hypothetical protein